MKTLNGLLLSAALLAFSAPPVAESQRNLTPEEIRKEGRAACTGLGSCLRQARSARASKLANCRTSGFWGGVCDGVGWIGIFLRVPGAGAGCESTLAVLRWECRFDANDDYRKAKWSCCSTYLQLRYGYDWPASLCGHHSTCK